MAVQNSQSIVESSSMIREMGSRSSDYDDDTFLTYYETTVYPHKINKSDREKRRLSSTTRQVVGIGIELKVDSQTDLTHQIPNNNVKPLLFHIPDNFTGMHAFNSLGTSTSTLTCCWRS